MQAWQATPTQPKGWAEANLNNDNLSLPGSTTSTRAAISISLTAPSEKAVALPANRASIHIAPQPKATKGRPAHPFEPSGPPPPPDEPPPPPPPSQTPPPPPPPSHPPPPPPPPSEPPAPPPSSPPRPPTSSPPPPPPPPPSEPVHPQPPPPPPPPVSTRPPSPPPPPVARVPSPAHLPPRPPSPRGSPSRPSHPPSRSCSPPPTLAPKLINGRVSSLPPVPLTLPSKPIVALPGWLATNTEGLPLVGFITAAIQNITDNEANDHARRALAKCSDSSIVTIAAVLGGLTPGGAAAAALAAGLGTPLGMIAESHWADTIEDPRLRDQFEDATIGRAVCKALTNMLGTAAGGAAGNYVGQWLGKYGTTLVTKAATQGVQKLTSTGASTAAKAGSKAGQQAIEAGSEVAALVLIGKIAEVMKGNDGPLKEWEAVEKLAKERYGV